MYSMENLVEIFSKHADIFSEQNDKLLEEFKKNNPDAPTPEWYTRDFCINTALASICREIIKLKNVE